MRIYRKLAVLATITGRKVSFLPGTLAIRLSDCYQNTVTAKLLCASRYAPQ